MYLVFYLYQSKTIDNNPLDEKLKTKYYVYKL